MRRSAGEGSIWTVERNGKTYYIGSITLGKDENGKSIRKTTGSFKKSRVVDKLNTWKYEAKNKLLSSDPTITLRELFKAWIYDYKRNEIQNNTFAEYEVCYRLRIASSSLSNVKVKDITLDMLQRYFNDLKRQGWSDNVIKKTYIKINSCFTFAEIHGIINKNYCKGVIIGKVQKKKDDQYKVFTKEEQEAIIQSLDFRNVVDCIIYFTFYTGLRLGEVLAIKWENIRGNILSVKEQYQKDVQIDEHGQRRTIYIFKDMLKTPHSQREIPLPKKLIELLENMIRIDSLVFCDENGEPLERKKPDRRIKSICRELGIDDSRTFHSIRHTYATRLFEMDIPVKTVQSLLGHSDIQTTMNIYTHVMKEKKLEILEKLDDM